MPVSENLAHFEARLHHFVEGIVGLSELDTTRQWNFDTKRLSY